MAKTKIIATIGPACDTSEMIEKLIIAGVDIFRFNLKHNDQAWHNERIQLVKEVFQKLQKPSSILLDLQGPEIRIGNFEETELVIQEGETVRFGLSRDKGEKTIVVDNVKLLTSLGVGQRILIDDGQFEFKVTATGEKDVHTIVIKGGVLKSRKGVNIPGLEVELPTLIDRDLAYLEMASREAVDFIALSFARRRNDVRILRDEMKKRGVHAHIIAKIENQVAVTNLDELIDEADGIMVARGDLGVEIDLFSIPFWQKEIIRKCRDKGKPVITATQMLQSMVDNPNPTRAEVSDVANAVYDRTDAVMLSGETAQGNFPVQSVEMMNKVISYTETKLSQENLEDSYASRLDAIVHGAFSLYRGLKALGMKEQAFVVFSDSGATVRLLSRLRPEIPIIAVTRNKEISEKLTICYGVRPYTLATEQDTSMDEASFLNRLVSIDAVKKGSQVIVVRGKMWGKPGQTNTISLESV